MSGLSAARSSNAVAGLAGAQDPLATFNQHTDYVNCLAGGKSRAKVASAGLRAEVFLWDIQRGIRIHEQVHPLPLPPRAHKACRHLKHSLNKP